MSQKLDGAEQSLWMATTPQTQYPQLGQDTGEFDLAVVGGGITGIMAAYFAQRQGLRTILIDKGRLVEWTTGGTTAKLASQHYLIYDFLIRHHGLQVAQAFADANQKGIAMVEELSAEHGIDCEFSRRSAYVYTAGRQNLQRMHAEVAAASKLGLPASFTAELDLPFPVAGAVEFTDQAQFHPRKFLLPLAQHLTEHGVQIYEHTEATDITPGSPNRIHTKGGQVITARHVLQASGEPFWQNELFSSAMWLKMSYALAVKLRNGADYPSGMYITTDDPMRTMRTASYNGEPVLIFGGESHEYDEKTYDEQARYAALIEDVHDRFDVDRVLYRWLAGDYMPYDRIPFIGALPEHPTVHVITGYRAWGLAWALSAAQAIVAAVASNGPSWLEHFSLDRLKKPLPPQLRHTGF